MLHWTGGYLGPGGVREILPYPSTLVGYPIPLLSSSYPDTFKRKHDRPSYYLKFSANPLREHVKFLSRHTRWVAGSCTLLAYRFPQSRHVSRPLRLCIFDRFNSRAMGKSQIISRPMSSTDSSTCEPASLEVSLGRHTLASTLIQSTRSLRLINHQSENGCEPEPKDDERCDSPAKPGARSPSSVRSHTLHQHRQN